MGNKSVKLNFIYNAFRNILNVCFPLITAPYVARVLEPDGVGLFNFASTYANYFALFAALGSGMYGIREIAKEKFDIEKQTRIVSEICSLLLVTTFCCTLIFLGSVFFVPQLNENYFLFLLAGFGLYITPFKIDWYYQGIEEFGYITLRSLIIKILSIFALFVFVKDKDDLAIMILLNIASVSLNELWNFAKLYKSGVHPYFTLHFSQHIKPMLVLFASMVAISVYTMLDTLMLGFITDYEEVGYYNNANHIAKAILPVATSLAVVVMPRLSYYAKNEEWETINRLMDKSLSIVSFLCFPLCFALIAIAPTFIPLFLGDLFIGSIVPLQILACLIVAIGFNNLLGIQILVGMGKDKQFLWAVLVGTVSNFILNLISIPFFGSIGAATASVLAETFILIVEIYLVGKYTQVKLPINKEFYITILISAFYFPLVALLGKYLDGWFLVGTFVIVGSFYYLSVQYCVKNTIIKEFETIIKKKIKI